MFFHRHQLSYDHTVSFRGSRLNYRVYGNPSNPPVVLVHGAIFSRDWEKFESVIAKDFYVYILDLPGFGGSDHIPNGKYSIRLFADALASFVTQLNLQATPIIAVSMGTLVVALAAARGDLKGKLVLGGMPFALPSGTVNWANKAPLWLKRFILKVKFLRRRILLPLLDSTLNEGNVQSAGDKLALMASTHHHTIADIDLSAEAELIASKYFSQVNNPRLILYGEGDPLRLGAKAKGVAFISIPGAGHNLYRTNPEAAAKIIKNFLKTS